MLPQWNHKEIVIAKRPKDAVAIQKTTGMGGAQKVILRIMRYVTLHSGNELLTAAPAPAIDLTSGAQKVIQRIMRYINLIDWIATKRLRRFSQ